VNLVPVNLVPNAVLPGSRRQHISCCGWSCQVGSHRRICRRICADLGSRQKAKAQTKSRPSSREAELTRLAIKEIDGLEPQWLPPISGAFRAACRMSTVRQRIRKVQSGGALHSLMRHVVYFDGRLAMLVQERLRRTGPSRAQCSLRLWGRGCGRSCRGSC